MRNGGVDRVPTMERPSDCDEGFDRELVSKLEGRFSRSDVVTKLEAIHTLEQVGCGRASLALLKRLVRSEEEPEVRTAAKNAFAVVLQRYKESGSSLDGSDLLDEEGRLDTGRFLSLLNDPDPVVRLNVLLAVRGLDLESAADILRRRLAEEDDPWVLSTLVKTVVGILDERDLDRIEELVSHEDARVAANALEVLEELSPRRALERARKCLTHSDSRVRTAALAVMVRRVPGEVEEELARMLRSPDPSNRENALYCLSRLDAPPPRLISVLLECFIYESDVHLMKKESSLLEANPSPATLGAMRFLSRSLDERTASIAAELSRRMAEALGMDEAGCERAEMEFISSIEFGEVVRKGFLLPSLPLETASDSASERVRRMIEDKLSESGLAQQSSQVSATGGGTAAPEGRRTLAAVVFALMLTLLALLLLRWS